MGILEPPTFFALFGSRKEPTVGTIVLLPPDVVPKAALQEIPCGLPFSNLRHFSHLASRETLLHDYVQSLNPGTIIGAEDRQTIGFSSGWYYQTGFVFSISPSYTPTASQQPKVCPVVTDSLGKKKRINSPVCVPSLQLA